MTTIGRDGLVAFYYQNSNALVLDGLQLYPSLAYADDSTPGLAVAAFLVPGGADDSQKLDDSDIVLSYEAGSKGKWYGIFPTSIALAVGSAVDVIVLVTGDPSLSARWRVPCRVTERTAP